MIQVNLAPRMFAQIVLEDICGEPSLVTDAIINKFNAWIRSGNKKESYSPDDIKSAINFIMG
jgi:hypothetical protein